MEKNKLIEQYAIRHSMYLKAQFHLTADYEILTLCFADFGQDQHERLKVFYEICCEYYLRALVYWSLYLSLIP